MKTMRRARRAAILVLMGLAVAEPAAAQTVFGIRGGVTADPRQGFGGFQMEWTALPPHTNISFRPDVEVAAGAGATVVTGDFRFAYWVTLSPQWQAYVGGGPAIVYARQNVDCGDAAGGCGTASVTGGGYAFMVGFQNRRGLFVELAAGGGTNASLRLAVGIALKGRR